MPQSKTINIKGTGPVLLERSTRAKRLNITIKPFKGVRVAVPEGISFTFAEQFARSKSEWLQHHLLRIKKFEKLCKSAALKKNVIDREKAGKVLVQRLEEIAEKHGYTYNRVSIRNQKTRWGSCSGNNNISLNVKLTLLPGKMRDFILLHELVHTRVKNHGKKFWAEIIKAEPNSMELAKQVNRQSIRLL